MRMCGRVLKPGWNSAGHRRRFFYTRDYRAHLRRTSAVRQRKPKQNKHVTTVTAAAASQRKACDTHRLQRITIIIIIMIIRRFIAAININGIVWASCTDKENFLGQVRGHNMKIKKNKIK